MADKRNALAELAKEMQSIINALETDNFSTVGIGNLCKAQHIITELAEVQEESVYGNRTLYLIASADAIEKSIAIAKE